VPVQKYELQSGLLISTGRTEPAGYDTVYRSGWSETGGNRANSNFKPNSLVQAVGTGIPTGLTGIADQFDRFPVV
jgi:hypothetical protein